MELSLLSTYENCCNGSNSLIKSGIISILLENRDILLNSYIGIVSIMTTFYIKTTPKNINSQIIVKSSIVQLDKKAPIYTYNVSEM